MAFGSNMAHGLFFVVPLDQSHPSVCILSPVDSVFSSRVDHKIATSTLWPRKLTRGNIGLFQRQNLQTLHLMTFPQIRSKLQMLFLKATELA